MGSSRDLASSRLQLERYDGELSEKIQQSQARCLRLVPQACRVFLALAESAFGSGMAIYLSHFYPSHELGVRFAFYLTAGAIASAFGGALAYALVQTHTAIEGWRLLCEPCCKAAEVSFADMFSFTVIVEGIPTVLVSIWVFYQLPDSIETAAFLSEEERRILRARHPAKDFTHDFSQLVKGNVFGFLDRGDAAKALRDPLPWLNSLMLFGINVSYSSLPVFLPQILADSGFTSIHAQGLTAPPYLAGFCVSLAALWLSDRTQRRASFLIFFYALCASGYIALTQLTHSWARYAMIFPIAMSLFALLATLYMWLLSNQPSSSRKGGEWVHDGAELCLRI